MTLSSWRCEFTGWGLYIHHGLWTLQSSLGWCIVACHFAAEWSAFRSTETLFIQCLRFMLEGSMSSRLRELWCDDDRPFLSNERSSEPWPSGTLLFLNTEQSLRMCCWLDHLQLSTRQIISRLCTEYCYLLYIIFASSALCQSGDFTLETIESWT